MSNEIRAAMAARLNELESEVRSLKAALAAYDQVQLKLHNDGASETRFKGKEPIKSIRILLVENGGRMERQALMQALEAGGASIGKKRAHNNLRISIEVNVKNGNLIVDGNDIVLPEKSTAQGA